MPGPTLVARISSGDCKKFVRSTSNKNRVFFFARLDVKLIKCQKGHQRGFSSYGRARALQARGKGIDTLNLQFLFCLLSLLFFFALVLFFSFFVFFRSFCPLSPLLVVRLQARCVCCPCLDLPAPLRIEPMYSAALHCTALVIVSVRTPRTTVLGAERRRSTRPFEPGGAAFHHARMHRSNRSNEQTGVATTVEVEETARSHNRNRSAVELHPPATPTVEAATHSTAT
jgi:hypothetical protein